MKTLESALQTYNEKNEVFVVCVRVHVRVRVVSWCGVYVRWWCGGVLWD